MLVHYLLGTSQDWSDQKVDGSITDLLCPLCHEQLSVVDTHDRGMARAKLRCPNGHEVVTSITQLQQPSSGAVLMITQERDSKKAKPRLPLGLFLRTLNDAELKKDLVMLHSFVVCPECKSHMRMSQHEEHRDGVMIIARCLTNDHVISVFMGNVEQGGETFYVFEATRPWIIAGD